MSTNKMNIALIGFMGTGKSTVSRKLCKMLHMTEIDMDALIVEQQGMDIKDIFAQSGETGFRQIETQLVKSLADSENCIISCGGGTVTIPENVAALKQYANIVLLTATPQTVYNRVKNSDERPVLKGHMSVEGIAEIMQRRDAAYKNAADIIVSTDDKTVEEICEEIKSEIIK